MSTCLAEQARGHRLPDVALHGFNVAASIDDHTALRLVVGTRLDVGEELPAVDPDDPDFMFYVLYESLGELLYYIVAALTPGLPEPTRTDPRF